MSRQRKYFTEMNIEGKKINNTQMILFSIYVLVLMLVYDGTLSSRFYSLFIAIFYLTFFFRINNRDIHVVTFTNIISVSLDIYATLG